MRAFCFSVIALAAAWSAPLAAQETISKAQVRSDPPEVTHEQLRDVFWDMFPVQDLRSEDAPTMPLQGVSLDTRPRLTQFRNLCQRDRLVIVFDSPEDDAGPAMQQSAESFMTTSFYSFLEMPENYGPRGSHDQPQDLCAALPDDHPFFHADNDSIALYSHLALGELQAGIADGSINGVTCDSARDAQTCRELISAIGLADVQDASRCADEVDEICYQLALRPKGTIGEHLHIFTDGRVSGPFVAVLRAELRQSMVLFHPRPD